MTIEKLNVEKFHTTKLGAERIKRNLGLTGGDVVEYCKEKALMWENNIVRRGKNWYICTNDCVITVNAHSCTIITAKKIKQ